LAHRSSAYSRQLERPRKRGRPTLREWVKRAATDGGKRHPNILTTAERDELSELRKRVKRLEMEREIHDAPRSRGNWRPFRLLRRWIVGRDDGHRDGIDPLAPAVRRRNWEHQLIVLRRSSPRPRLRRLDRWLIATPATRAKLPPRCGGGRATRDGSPMASGGMAVWVAFCAPAVGSAGWRGGTLLPVGTEDYCITVGADELELTMCGPSCYS
jgi:hypothetical protein